MQNELELPPQQKLVLNLNPAHYHQTAREFLTRNKISLHRPIGIEILVEVLQSFIRIPYENLSKIIKYHEHHQDVLSLRLPDEVWKGYCQHKLGGTCFSLTFFLRAIVDFLGFSSYPVMAHMKAGINRHCALVVVFDGDHYLLDPGYVFDVPMQVNSEQRRLFRSAHAGVELRDGDAPLHYDIYTFTNNNFQWRYAFADLPVSDEDFLKHWLDSFSWNGMNGLCLTQARKDSLIFIHKYFMRETTPRSKHNFSLKRNREQTIQKIFDIPPQIVEEAEAAVQQRMARIRKFEIGSRR